MSDDRDVERRRRKLREDLAAQIPDWQEIEAVADRLPPLRDVSMMRVRVAPIRPLPFRSLPVRAKPAPQTAPNRPEET